MPSGLWLSIVFSKVRDRKSLENTIGWTEDATCCGGVTAHNALGKGVLPY